MSDGQKVLKAWADWISSFIAFPEVPKNQALVMALWCMHTWFAAKWPATAYLHITSDGPGCGKTTLMELMGMLSVRARLRATLRPLAVVRDIEENQGAVTYFFDQVESLFGGKLDDSAAILLTGYRDEGGRHGVTVGTKSVDFSTYCPKAFASVGDVRDDLRSRVILARLSFGTAERDWSEAALVRRDEAHQLLAMFSALKVAPAWVLPEGFVGREREVFTPLWSVAQALKLDGEMLTEIRRAFGSFSLWKEQAPRKVYRGLVNGEGEGTKDTAAPYALRALRDLAGVLPEAGKTQSGDLWTVNAIERLKALPDGPWEIYPEGRGLTADVLSGLLARFGVESEVVREGRGRSAKALNGFKGAKVRAALVKASESLPTA